MNKYLKTLAMSALVSVSAVSSVYAGQQSNTQSQTNQQSVSQSENFDDKTLMKFTEAMQAVGQVANKYEAEMQQVEKPEEAQEIQKAAQEEMVAEIENSGLTVDTYTTIAQAVQTDPELRERVLEMVESPQQS